MILDDPAVAYPARSKGELRLAYRLYRVVTNRLLYKIGMPLLMLASRIPLFHPLIRATLFRIFIGGETVAEVLKVSERLYQHGVYSILDFAVERAESPETQQKVLQAVYENIDRAVERDEIPLVVFKLTGITGVELPERISLGTATEAEKQRWQGYEEKVREVFEYARQRRITVCIDAEESWIQPAIDALVHRLTWEMNKDFPVVMQTIQLYRTDRLEYYQWYIDECRLRGVYGAMKLVRGAYLEKERRRAAEKGYPSPVHKTKAATDRDFNRAVLLSIAHADRIRSIIATHNVQSCQLAVDELQQRDLPMNHSNIWFSQLYGIRDNLTFALARIGANATKYIPYGPVKEVIPYLLRRMSENADALNYAPEELRLLKKALS